MLQILCEPNFCFSFIVRLAISIILGKNGVVIMIQTDLMKLWNLQLMWGFHLLFQSLKFCQLDIATKESFGIVPVPENFAEELGFERRKEPLDEVDDKGNLLHWGMPVNTLTWLSTRPSPPHNYLAKCQMTAHEVLPIHTDTANMTTYWSESILRVFWWYINVSQNIIPQVWS